MIRLLFILFLFIPSISIAFQWQNLWLTPNQQGAKLLKQNKPSLAAKKFTNSDWRGVANFEAKNYSQSAKDFSKFYYNKANALAFDKKFKQAIENYNQAIKSNPNNTDAKYNKNLINKLLKKQNKNNKSKKNKNNKSKQNHKNQNHKNQNHKNNKTNHAHKQKNQKQKNQLSQKKLNQYLKKQQLKQKLNQIPNNPGGLLQRQFLHTYYQRQQRGGLQW